MFILYFIYFYYSFGFFLACNLCQYIFLPRFHRVEFKLNNGILARNNDRKTQGRLKKKKMKNCYREWKKNYEEIEINSNEFGSHVDKQ